MMSFTARLTIRISVLVKDLRPVLFPSFAFVQIHAITDMLLATEMNTQIDSMAMQNSSNIDVDDAISQLPTNDDPAAETAGLHSLLVFYNLVF